MKFRFTHLFPNSLSLSDFPLFPEKNCHCYVIYLEHMKILIETQITLDLIGSSIKSDLGSYI